MRKTLLLVALLGSAVSACNRPPVPPAASHPPAAEFAPQSCPTEPAALTDEQAAAPNGDIIEQAFNDAVLLAGRACRDTWGRICRWHVERGMQGVTCPAAPGRPTSWRLGRATVGNG